MDKPGKARKILDILARVFPNPRTALLFSNPLELLIATILSAQATDKLINSVTPALFRKYRDAGAYARADLKEIEEDLRRVNFFRNKARNIRNCSIKLVKDFGGRVPSTLEDLTSLPGVGRKTANIVLGNAFGKNALAVDTHVKRVSRRLGLAKSENPDDIEGELSALIPEDRWTVTTHLLILHGRKTCTARNPLCEICPVREYCDYYKDVYSKSE